MGYSLPAYTTFVGPKDPHNMDKGSVRDRIDISHFAGPHQDHMQYKERMAAADPTIYWQEQVGEDKSHLVRASSLSYTDVAKCTIPQVST
jgi:hypothetical protein